MRLLLIRHGQTPANVIGSLDTDAPGPGLTALGAQQAEAVPEALREESVAAIYTSSLVRTHLTAAPLARARSLPTVELGELREIEAGSLEARTDLTSQREYMMTVFAWGQGDLGLRMPDGPDGHAFFARYDRAITHMLDAQRSGGTVVAVSHGAAIRCWLALRAENVGKDFLLTHPLDNTGIVVVEGDFTGGWRIVEWMGRPVGGAGLADAAADDPTGESLAQAPLLARFEEEGRRAGAALWPAAATWIPAEVTERLDALLAAEGPAPAEVERLSRAFVVAARNARKGALTPAEAQGRPELLERLRQANAERTAAAGASSAASATGVDEPDDGPDFVGSADAATVARRIRESRGRREARG